MQYVTSVLNEWGQFLTTVVVAAESEGCYRRMAKGLMARFERARAPAPTVIYADRAGYCSKSFDPVPISVPQFRYRFLTILFSIPIL